ncbi:Uncharacterized protein HZ326_14237 [Fusarium oxysporum f. sp. albedinis]|nr:Uncharacterized protein HZ326_14237 [Fusarium oxysporum f. sp. albedinis]
MNRSTTLSCSRHGRRDAGSVLLISPKGRKSRESSAKSLLVEFRSIRDTYAAIVSSLCSSMTAKISLGTYPQHDSFADPTSYSSIKSRSYATSIHKLCVFLLPHFPFSPLIREKITTSKVSPSLARVPTHRTAHDYPAEIARR